MNKTSLFILFILCCVFSKGQTGGDYVFESDSIHKIEITFTQINWWDTMSYNKEYSDANDTSIYIPATVVIDGTVLDSVGLRFRGFMSYYDNPTIKRSFKLDFNKYIPTQKYDDLKKLNLHSTYEDATMMREKIYLDILQNHNLSAPRINYSQLYINGVYWGLYYVLEQINKGFLKDRFGNKGGNLYKGDRPNYPPFTVCSTLDFLGYNQQAYYACYELKTNKTTNDWSAFVNLVDIINNTFPLEFKDSLGSILNTNSCLGAMTAGNIMGNRDAYWYDWQHNFYLYHNTETQLFEWITWDVGYSLGNGLPNSLWVLDYLNRELRYVANSNQPLAENMIGIPDYDKTIIDYACKIVAEDFNPDNLFPIIDSLANVIRPYVYADTNKFYTNLQFENNLEYVDVPHVLYGNLTNIGLKTFITRRYEALLIQLDTLNCPEKEIEDSLTYTQNNFEIYPNPASTHFIIKGPYTSFNINVYNSIGQLLYKENNVLESSKKIDVSRFSSGLIFIQIESNDNVVSYKLMKE